MSVVPDDAEAIRRAMARLRRALERRMSADEKAERAAARRTLKRGTLAGYDTAALGRLIRPKLDRDGRGWKAVADEIGVTSPDLSRIAAGQAVSAAKIFAVCDWARIDPRRFYVPPSARRFTGKALKQEGEPCPR